MNAAPNPKRPAAMSSTNHGASERRWWMMTSSTIVFSTTGVSAATAWPRIEMPKAMYTLRLCAMRNGNMRRSQPPASGGAGSGVGRLAACRALSTRMMVLFDGAAQRIEALDDGGAILGRRPQHQLEFGGHRLLGRSQGGRARERDLEAHPAAIADDVDPLHPASGLEPVEQPGQRRPRHGGLLGD